MRLNSENQKNRAMNGSRCSDHNLPDHYRTGSKNGHGAQQVYLSRSAGVPKGDHPPGSADIWYKIPKGVVPEGDT